MPHTFDLEIFEIFFLSICSTYLTQESICMLKIVFTRAPRWAGVAVPILVFFAHWSRIKNYGNRVWRKEKGGFNTQPAEGGHTASSCLNCPSFPPPHFPPTPFPPPHPSPHTLRSLGDYIRWGLTVGEVMRKKGVRTLYSCVVSGKMVIGWCQVAQ